MSNHLISTNVKLGENVYIGLFVNMYGCEIGYNTKVGAFVEIQKNAKIGNNCKISSHTFVCEGVIIEDRVFVGHSVTFINDRFPRSTNDDGLMKNESEWSLEPTIVKEGASIGSGSVIMCGITIGRNAIVGAGSVVTKNVEPGTIVAGNPARYIRGV
ncbi:MAG: N-acetyltransferase [Chitinispirillaceae bacterium]|nr:N-acetyltransferase [Chitinispirillaceae bacterium]